METYFKIRNYADKNGLSQIQLWYFHKQKPLIIDTGVKTKSIYFNGKSVISKCQDIKQDQDVLNDLLKQCKTKVDRIILDYKSKYGTNPPVEVLKAEYFKEATKIEQDQDVISLMEDWIKDKKLYIKNTKIYTTIHHDLKKLYPKKLYFREIDIKFNDKLIRYWLDSGIQNSTINKRMVCFKGFLKDCHYKGINEYDEYNKFKTKLTQLSNNVIVIPTAAEFETLCTKELKSKRLDYIRTLYCISASTGLRFSDAVRLTPDNIVIDENGEKYIISDITKTEDRIQIPLSPLAERMLEKYNYTMRSITNQKANKNLHDLFEHLEFNTMVTVYEKRGIEVKPVKDFKYNLMTFHSSRKYFISTCVNTAGIKIKNVMEWSGHKSLSVVNKYLQKGLDEQTEMRKVFK